MRPESEGVNLTEDVPRVSMSPAFTQSLGAIANDLSRAARRKCPERTYRDGYGLIVERPVCSHCEKIGVKCEVFPRFVGVTDSTIRNRYFGSRSFSMKVEGRN